MHICEDPFCFSSGFQLASGHPSRRQPSDSLTVLEEDALENLMIRRSLLLIHFTYNKVVHFTYNKVIVSNSCQKRHDQPGNLLLRAAHAANFIDR
ncbi:hypothetical protein DVH24_006502 [Malus domestica]|uniref:Uncharacterized protein n=1 Tax=Malus domestica TaxID=3750 RepID=A0A498KHL6_MALDO|nr:hypothetical protein DVH24_006502 [Malus domestica]